MFALGLLIKSAHLPGVVRPPRSSPSLGSCVGVLLRLTSALSSVICAPSRARDTCAVERRLPRVAPAVALLHQRRLRDGHVHRVGCLSAMAARVPRRARAVARGVNLNAYYRECITRSVSLTLLVLQTKISTRYSRTETHAILTRSSRAVILSQLIRSVHQID